VDGSNQGSAVTLDGNGRANLVLPALAGGGHTIAANFLPSANFIGSSNSTSYTVAQDGTSVAVTSSLSPSTFGQTVTLTAKITNTSTSTAPVGNVQFVIDGANRGSAITLSSLGQATISVSNLGIGPHRITANYSGNANFASGSNGLNALNLTVNPVGTSTTLAASRNVSALGQVVAFAATVKEVGALGIPTGVVTFVITGAGVNLSRSVNLLSGRATMAISTLPVGNYNVTATYNGNAAVGLGGSSSTAIAGRVGRATITTLRSSLNPAISGQSVTFTATLNNPAATGKITFYVDGVVRSVVNLTSGPAKLTLSTLAVGSHVIRVVYSGDAIFLPSSASLTEVVFRSLARTI
jgi:hypothetical protein